MIPGTSGYRQSTLLPPHALWLALLCQVPMLAASWPLRPGMPAVAAGVLLLGAGLLLNVAAARAFRRHAVGVRPFTHTPALVEDGPFRFSRNPMYLGLVAICAGFTLLSGALANLWLSVAYFIWLHHAWVLPEERFLRDRFGAAWQRHAQRVPRWLLLHGRTDPGQRLSP